MTIPQMIRKAERELLKLKHEYEQLFIESVRQEIDELREELRDDNPS